MNAQAKANKLNALTGLRAIAALAVFAQHFMGVMDCQVISGPFGSLAVSFFFVLSGFILVYVYKDRLTSTSTRKFYFTRFARIWPLHAVCLLMVVLLLTKYLPPTDLPWIRAFSHLTLLQTWYPASDWVACYNGVSWSISAEAFFYLVFPWLLLGTSRQFWAKYTCVFLGTIGCLVLMALTLDGTIPMKEVAGSTLDPRKIAQFCPPFRLLEFATGMAAGMVFLNRRGNGSAATALPHRAPTVTATAIEVLVLGLSIWLLPYFFSDRFVEVYLFCRTDWPAAETLGVLTLEECSFTRLRFTSLPNQPDGCLGSWLSKTMVFLGEISFAFYMIHYSLIQFVKHKYWFGSNFSLIYFAVLTLALSIAVSAWLYYLVEIPAKQALLKWYAGDAKLKQLLFEMLVKPHPESVTIVAVTCSRFGDCLARGDHQTL